MNELIKILHEILGTTTKIALCVKLIAIFVFLFCAWMCANYFFQHYPEAEVTSKPFDYNGMLVGFFTLLVTLLVGWQIYSTIKAKQEIAEAKELVEKQFEDRLKKLENCCNERKEEIKDINKKIDTGTNNLKQQIDDNLKENRMYAESLYELEEARTQLAVFQLYNSLRTNLGLLNREIPERNNMLDKSLFGVSKSLSALKNSNQRDNDKSRTYSLLVTLIGNIKDYGQLKYISSSTFSSIIDEVTDDKLPNTIRSKDKLIQELNELKTESEKLQEEQDRKGKNNRHNDNQ